MPSRCPDSAAGVVLDGGQELDGRVGAREVADDLGDLVDGQFVWVADVDRARIPRPGQCEQAFDGVVDVAQGPRLAARAGDGHRFAGERLADERRDHPAVMGPHPGPVGVEDAGDSHIGVALAAVCERQRLGVALGLVVHAARADGIDVAPIGFGLGCSSGSPYTSLVDASTSRAPWRSAAESALAVPMAPVCSVCSGSRR